MICNVKLTLLHVSEQPITRKHFLAASKRGDGGGATRPADKSPSRSAQFFRGSHVSTFLASSLSLADSVVAAGESTPPGLDQSEARNCRHRPISNQLGSEEGRAPVVKLVLFDCQLLTFTLVWAHKFVSFRCKNMYGRKWEKVRNQKITLFSTRPSPYIVVVL